MAKRQSIMWPGFAHSNPIPNASRIVNVVMSSVIGPRDPSTGTVPETLEEQVKNLFLQLSAAIKAVPVEQNEAASLDGANAWQLFRNVTVPGIRTSLIVVLTTITIASLKVYDIVAVMTGGRSNSTVVAFEMVNQQQRFQSYGHSSALALVLFLFVTPLIVYNVRQMRKQKEIR